MRNLKKILALVLALVMSLSLMATAGAKDFPDTEGMENDAYALAVDILSDLSVFAGDQNGNFNPTQPITRAEVAAIIYRITTGDIGVEQHKTYAPYNQFPDIQSEDWYAGYVTYCANAGYIKGRNTGKFDPKDSVTGYEVLAMILRAVGYDKNNEFVGSNWQKNTASIATQRGVLKNVLKDPAVRLSEPATRQVVAELLFQASFINQVTWNAGTLSYREDGETLAKEHLGTEKITGVVMANQWANINDNEAGGYAVLAEGKTQLKPEGEAALTLDISTALEAVGLTYSAYIQNGTRVLGDLEYSDKNVDNSNEGAASTVARVAGGLSTAGATYFLDYDEDWDEWDESDYLVRYAIAQSSCNTRNQWADYITGLVKNPDGTDIVAGHSYTTRDIKVKDADGNETTVSMYVVSITPNSRITETDIAIMRSIFYTADRTGSNTDVDGLRDYVIGEVYIGTTSMVDESDTLSWKEFTQKYFWQDGQRRYDGCNNGESLRVIDNNGDGKAEYVFKVQYCQDQAVGTYKDALEFNDEWGWLYYADEIIFADEDIDVGDVVNYTWIDGLVTMYKADTVTGAVTNKNFKDVTIAVNGETYGQSGIFNLTGMDELIMQTADVTDYIFYLDEYGYIRSYKLAHGNQYALVTEMYNTTNQAFNYVNTGTWIAEIKAGDAALAEYTLANPGSLANNNLNPFISEYAWTNRVTRYNNTDLNFLQPAIAHLAVRPGLFDTTPVVPLPYEGATVGREYGYALTGTGTWNRGVFEMVDSGTAAGATPTTNYGVFDYGPVTGETYTVNHTAVGGSNVGDPVNHSFSFTNVAAYALDDNGNVTLNTAAKLMTNNKGEQLYYGPSYKADGTVAYAYGQRMTIGDWAEYNKDAGIAAADTVAKMEALIKAGNTYFPVYATDYIQLQKEDVSSGMRHFYIDTTYAAKYSTNANGYVNATVETEFYIAMPNGVLYQVGYAELPAIEKENVRAAYAVANNTSTDASGYDYWIADVIVIEVNELKSAYDSVSLMYYNPYETSGSVRFVQSLNSEWRAYQPDAEAEADIPVVPKNSNGGSASWGNHSWTGANYGFYEVYDSEFANGELTSGRVDELVKVPATDWDGHGIYAGTIQRVWGLTSSEYIDVDYLGRTYTGTPINDKDVDSVTVSSTYDVPIYRVNGQSTSDLRLGRRVTTSDVQPGDEIILVYNKAGSLAYIVDLASRNWGTPSTADDYNAPNWLWTTYQAIVASQQPTAGDTLNFNLMMGPGDVLTVDGVEYRYNAANNPQPVTVKVSSGEFTTFKVQADLGTTIAAFTRHDSLGAWTIIDTTLTAATPTEGEVLEVVLRNPANAGRAARAAITDAAATVWTVNGLNKYIEDVTVAAAAGEYTLAELDEISDLLADVKTSAEAIDNDAAGDIGSTVDNATTDLGNIAAEEGGALDTARTAATKAVNDYRADEVALLTDPDASTAATKKTTATEAIATATTQEALDTAVKAYQEAIDKILDAELEGDALNAAREAGVSTVNAYKTSEIETLTAAEKVQVNTAKNTAITAIRAATTQVEINAAVAEYKAAVDALFTVTVTFTATNATVLVKQEDESFAEDTSATANKGSTVSFKVTPADGYAIDSVKQGETVLAASGEGVYTTGELTANATVTITTRELSGVAVSVESAAGGETHLKVSPTKTEAKLLSAVELTLTADEGYALPATITGVSLNGVMDAASDQSGTTGWSYNAGTGKITFSKTVTVSGPIVVYAVALPQYTISVSGTGIKAYTDVKVTQGTDFTAIGTGGAITAIQAADNYVLPAAAGVVVKMGNTTLEAGDDKDYTWNAGVITFKGDKTVTDNITIVVTAVRQYTITVTGTGIEAYTAVKVDEGTAFTAIGTDGAITSITASTNYDLPDEITVKLGNTTLEAGDDKDYTWNAGVITFKGTKTMTDNITVEVTATRQQITIGAVANVTFTPGTVGKGENLKSKTITVAPEAGYTLGEITAISVDGGTALTANTDYSIANGQTAGTKVITFLTDQTPSTSLAITVSATQG